MQPTYPNRITPALQPICNNGRPIQMLSPSVGVRNLLTIYDAIKHCDSSQRLRAGFTWEAKPFLAFASKKSCFAGKIKSQNIQAQRKLFRDIMGKVSDAEFQALKDLDPNERAIVQNFVNKIRLDIRTSDLKVRDIKAALRIISSSYVSPTRNGGANQHRSPGVSAGSEEGSGFRNETARRKPAAPARIKIKSETSNASEQSPGLQASKVTKRSAAKTATRTGRNKAVQFLDNPARGQSVRAPLSAEKPAISPRSLLSPEKSPISPISPSATEIQTKRINGFLNRERNHDEALLKALTQITDKGSHVAQQSLKDLTDFLRHILRQTADPSIEITVDPGRYESLKIFAERWVELRKLGKKDAETNSVDLFAPYNWSPLLDQVAKYILGNPPVTAEQSEDRDGGDDASTVIYVKNAAMSAHPMSVATSGSAAPDSLQPGMREEWDPDIDDSSEDMPSVASRNGPSHIGYASPGSSDESSDLLGDVNLPWRSGANRISPAASPTSIRLNNDRGRSKTSYEISSVDSGTGSANLGSASTEPSGNSMDDTKRPLESKLNGLNPAASSTALYLNNDSGSSVISYRSSDTEEEQGRPDMPGQSQQMRSRSKSLNLGRLMRFSILTSSTKRLSNIFHSPKSTLSLMEIQSLLSDSSPIQWTNLPGSPDRDGTPLQVRSPDQAASTQSPQLNGQQTPIASATQNRTGNSGPRIPAESVSTDPAVTTSGFATPSSAMSLSGASNPTISKAESPTSAISNSGILSRSASSSSASSSSTSGSLASNSSASSSASSSPTSVSGTPLSAVPGSVTASPVSPELESEPKRNLVYQFAHSPVPMPTDNPDNQDQ